MDPAGASPAPSRFAAWRRPARRGLAALGALALGWVAAHSLADRAAMRARIRERAVATLATRLPSAVLGDEVSVDWLLRATVGPLTIPASARGAPPVVRIEQVKVRAAWLPLLSGRVEPASVQLVTVRLAPGPGGLELRALLDRLRRAPPEATAAASPTRRPDDPDLHLHGLTVALALGARTVELGPFDVKLERSRRGEETLEAELGLPGGGHAEATLHRTVSAEPARRTAGAAASGQAAGPTPADHRPAAPPSAVAGAAAIGPAAARPPAGPGPWSLSAHLAATAADLAGPLRRRAAPLAGGALTVQAEAEGTAAGGRATVRMALSDLVLRGAALGPEPVGPLNLSGDAALEVHLAEHRLWLRGATLRPAGPLAIEAVGSLDTSDLTFELAVTVPPVDYGALLAALPRTLAPGPDAPRPAGAVGGSLALSGPLRAPEAWTVKAEVNISGLRAAARTAPPSPLRAPFTAHPGGEDGPAIQLGPASPAFVPISELPEHVVRAVTTSEDAGFFGHHGFDFDELRSALLEGVRAGKLGRGGSTISQQLAKNLFLSRDRTLARKAREALITVALEGTVGKARLLEIYLNLIEWGPGLYGIGPAAHHYLGKDARALTPREACFLATLIPGPLRAHAALAAGAPLQRWAERIDDLLRKLGAAGVLDEATLARELEAPLALAAWVPRTAAAGAEAGGPPPGREEEAEPPTEAPDQDEEATPDSTEAPTAPPESTEAPTSTSTAGPAPGP